MKIMVTAAGLRKMEDDLALLKGKEMREAVQVLNESRDADDLSENSEYELAKANIDLLNIKIQTLEEKIKNAVVIVKGEVNTDTVQLFTTVTLLNHKTKKEITYEIVTDDEVDTKNNKISHNTPVAQGLIGHKKGETVSVKVPVGTIDFEILNIK